MNTNRQVKNDLPAAYQVTGKTQADFDQDLINRAIAILDSRIKHESALDNPNDVKQYLRLRFSGFEHEVFSCLFLDNRHRPIELVELSRGTIDGASVHPREVVKAALKCNAAAVILTHNHPSGIAEPSEADKHITNKLNQALALIDIRVLDHVVIGESQPVSFAERGLI